jgi:hypothetical protein
MKYVNKCELKNAIHFGPSLVLFRCLLDSVFDFCLLSYVKAGGLPPVKLLSDERIGLSFTISAGPVQRIHSRVRVYFIT